MLQQPQWELVLPIIAKSQDNRKKVRGRPEKHSDRAILEGVFWILKTGARWQDLPRAYPPYQTCFRRFKRWVKTGVFRKALKALARDVKERGGLDLAECYIDATFIPAKKGDTVWVKPNGERVRNSWQLQTALLLQYPSTQQLLHPQKSNWSKRRFDTDFFPRDHSG